MNTQSTDGMMCKAKDCMKRLCSMKVKDNLDFSMTVTGKNTEGKDETCFNKSIKSDTELSLVKFLGILLAIGIAMSLICSAVSMLKK